MVLREQDKHFLASLYAAVAIIFTWKGLWDGIYLIPYLGEMKGVAFVFFFMGFAFLTFSGLIFNQFDPLGNIEKSTTKVLHSIYQHPEKHHFQVKYHDKSSKEDITLETKNISKIEKGTLVIHHPKKNKEVFIPLHRITEIAYKGKRYWRL